MKKFSGTPPLLDRNHPMDVSRLSRGNVPFVPQTFCPLYVELKHTTGLGLPRSPGTRPQTIPGKHRPPNSPLCVLWVSAFSSPSLVVSSLPVEIPRKEWQPSSQHQGAVKGFYLKGLFAQSRLFYREMDCPVRFHSEMDCPVQWSLATPSALESQSRANQGSVVANPIFKCRRHKAGHLQVRVAVGKLSTCVLKEAPLNKGPLGFPHNNEQECRSKKMGSVLGGVWSQHLEYHAESIHEAILWSKWISSVEHLRF